MNILEINNNFNFNDLDLEAPSSLTGGNYFCKIINKNNFKSIYLQLPKCSTKQGVIKNNSKTYTDLMFNSSEILLLKWLEEFELYCQKKILEKKELWFHNDFTLNDIQEMMNPVTRLYKSGKFTILRCNIKNNKIKIYDENENNLEIANLKNDDFIVPLVNLNGIKFNSNNFTIEINLVQLMIVSQDEELDNCIININKNKKMHDNLDNLDNLEKKDNKAFKSNDNLENKDNDNLENKENKENKHNKANDNLEINDNKANDNLENNNNKVNDNLENNDNKVNDNLENNDNKANNNLENNDNKADDNLENNDNKADDNLENKHNKANNNLENKDNKDNGNLENNLEYNLNLKEVDLDEIYEDKEKIDLKDAELVYYEIYKAARDKAKQIKKSAIEAYLEAKKIKNQYMLDNIDDSSDSEIEELEFQ